MENVEAQNTEIKEVNTDTTSVESILNNFKSNVLSIVEYFQDFGNIAKEVDSKAMNEKILMLTNGLSAAGINVNEEKGVTTEARPKSKSEILKMLRSISVVVNDFTKPIKHFEIFSRGSFLGDGLN